MLRLSKESMDEKNNQEIDAVFAEELGLQLFPYMENYYCEVKAHLK